MMFKMSGRAAVIRAMSFAGAVAAGLGGLTATAQAFPSAAPVQAFGGYEAVQYYDDGFPRPMRHHRFRHGYDRYGDGYGYGHDGRYGRHGYGHHRYGENSHPRHPGHAGLYDCGPGGKATRLSRKACGGNDRFQHLGQSY